MKVIQNAKRNIYFGIVNRVVILIIPFIERTAIQTMLGSRYLGLDSLFVAIIQVLNLSELGFSSAMVYNMYEPVAENNTLKINALLNYYKKVYRNIGGVILGIGLTLIPFLSHLIKGSYPTGINITVLYLIYLLNTVISYFLYSYYNSVIVVHQREDVRSTINSGVKIGLALSQVYLLWVTKNYYLFVTLMPIFTVINNVWIAWRVRTMFPQYKAEGSISIKEKKNIKRLAIGTFVQQACSVTRNSLDSICISAFLGLTLTAIYSNYYLIMNGVITFVAIFTASFVGAVGNHVAIRSVKENFDEMKKLDFVYLWISGWCTICLLCLYQPFMELWMGAKMMLPYSAVILFCGYFYLLKLGDVRTLYSSANGLWWEQRYRSIGETILNIILNITLGKFFGIHGIIIATMLSLFLCNYLWATGIVFRLYFSISRRKEYYLYQFRETLVMILSGVVTYYFCSLLPFNNFVQQLLLRAAFCCIIPNIIYYLIYKKTNKFLYVKRVIQGWRKYG